MSVSVAPLQAVPAEPIERLDLAALDRVGDDQMSALYQNNAPYPHIAIDGLFPDSVLRAALREIELGDIPQEKNNYSTYRKFRQSDYHHLPPAVKALIDDLNSAQFIRFLERLTGISGLLSDPYLEGGGVHRIGQGGFLKVHTDFNYHRILKLHRRLNLLLYLNEDWNEEWGGQIEMWDKDVQASQSRYAPIWGRMVIFSTTDTSYHGHPDPLQCPDDRMRNSIALYYYSADRPTDEVQFAKSEMTNYRTRPGEGFKGSGKAVHLLHQLEIRSPFFKRITSLLRGKHD